MSGIPAKKTLRTSLAYNKNQCEEKQLFRDALIFYNESHPVENFEIILTDLNTKIAVYEEKLKQLNEHMLIAVAQPRKPYTKRAKVTKVETPDTKKITQ